MSTSTERPSRSRAARVMLAGAFVLSLGVWAVPASAQTTSGGAGGSSGGGASTSRSSSSGWRPGPGASGSDTYVGRIETIREGSQTISARSPAANGSTVRVTGWAVDTTAQGWAGFDKVQVFMGTAEDGKMLATGSVGQSRPDVAEAFGKPDFTKSGFFVDVPLAGIDAAQQSLNLYLHTADKGWWFRSFTVYQKPVAAAQAIPGQPIVFISSPTQDQRLSLSKDYNRAASPKGFNVASVALDQNLQVDNSDPTKQCLWTGATSTTGRSDRFAVGTADNPQNCGIDRVQVYMDGPRNDPNGYFFGNATAGQLLPSPTTTRNSSNDAGVPTCGKPASPTACSNYNGYNPGGNYSPLAAGYGTQFWGAGFQTGSVNLGSLQRNNPVTPTRHTAFVYARSYLSGIEHMDSVDFWVID